jgi:hypothetical protein
MSDKYKGDKVCEEQGRLPFRKAWAHIEIPVFYMYILSGILYIFLNYFFSVNPAYIDEDSQKHITFEDADFLECHQESQSDFCLYTFEGLCTIYVLFEELTIYGFASNQGYSIPMALELF